MQNNGIMISKGTIKLIHSLDLKKNRRKEGLFVAEGPKVVGDLMESLSPALLIATEEWIKSNSRRLEPLETKDGHQCRIIDVTDEDLRKASFLMHPQQVIALFPLPCNQCPENADFAGQLILALDGVQDPGNLGTIIRIADWFGIGTILCSNDTADAYNPKVVQATMGSIARVNVIYTDLEQIFDRIGNRIPIYGTLLDGKNIYEQELTPNGIIVMGNEGNGISAQIRRKVTNRLLIPNFSNGDTAESLNVAIATAITCSEFRRRNGCQASKSKRESIFTDRFSLGK